MTLNPHLRILTVAAAAGILAGCQTSPRDRSGELGIEPPPAFTAKATGKALSQEGWLADFDDATLTQLVEEAQRNNQNLQAAAARLRAAKAGVGIAAAGLFPTGSGSFNTARNKRSAAGGFRLVNPVTDLFQLNASVAWELDLWGRILNRTRAATGDFEATAADYRSASLSLAANVAGVWFNALEAELQARLARQTVSSFEDNQKVVEQGFERGVSTALDVRLTRANVASARATLKNREQQRDGAIRSLETLLGRYPASSLKVADSLPPLKRDVPAGLPSGLLTRRPDILAAERRLAAADERYKASRKDLLPTISLSASGGTQSDELHDILDPQANIWRLAANATQPIFQGGRLVRTIQQNKANTEAALADYRQTALTAFQEVETALAAGTFLREREAALRTAAEESRQAEEIAWSQYQKGLVDIITVLESQRRSFNSQSSLIQIVNQRLQNRLNLYLALGGEFGPEPSVADTTAPERTDAAPQTDS